MEASAGSVGGLYAISDLHVGYEENRRLIERIHPRSRADWLIVAGDVADTVADVEWTLGLLRERFAKVIWCPGNHELWTPARDPVRLRGVARYEHLVDTCRKLGVLTPEDSYPVWRAGSTALRIAPLLLLYDYTFRVAGTDDKEESLALAYEAGVVCTDERLLHPDPYPSREAWCRARVALTERRLAACGSDVPLVLVNHWPLVREPTEVLYHPEFAQWCGTVLTADWHRRFNVAVAVYGHLHIRRSTVYDGVPFEEVSLGYPREWQPAGPPTPLLRRIG
ncbi:metallophosphoesterase family protein [Streptomyces sp. NPDC007856]|uniref:metallophosphoesterase family protein n=1 Tax=Streptomyces sp. NPDC007856 TaxID=3364781 RepID=UPI00367525EE